MARVNELAVWLRGEKVARLRRTGPGRVSVEYTQAVLDTVPLGTPLLSCSLPVRRGRAQGWPFVTGLLPEGQHRLSMSRLAGVETLDALGMLARFGRDVAGALVIGPDSDTGTGTGAGPADAGEPGTVALSDADLAADVADLPARSLALHDDSQLSLAGLEDKLLLAKTARGWARPVHGYPSTHILKVDNRVHRGTVVLEHDCLQLARRAGLPAAESALIRVGDADCIVVTRYDRVTVEGSPQRIHQEDSCQALGIDPAAHDGQGRNGKYEEFGGPALAQIAGLLSAYAPDPELELARLLERVTFTVVIGDADAHGKNLSLLHPDPAHVRLAPLYDCVPTAVWPALRPSAAMRINGGDRLAGVTRQDLVGEAYRWGMATRRAEGLVAAVCDRLRAAASELPARQLDLASIVAANLDRLAN